MQAKSWIMLQVLLNRFHGGAQDSLTQTLSEEQSQILRNQNVDSTNLDPAFLKPKELLAKIHYSWILPLLEKFPGDLQSLLLSSFSERQQESLSKKLGTSLAASPPKIVQTYLLGLFYEQLHLSEVLPIEYLPPSRLNAVTELSKDQLQTLFDYLGIYDLALQIRQIVDQKKIKNIRDCLSLPRERFLKRCLGQKELVKSPEINLDAWDGDPKKLRKVLHRRGMIRLGYALCGQHPDLIWHITRTLDRGRAEVLAKHVSGKEIPKVTEALAEQVLNLVQYLKEQGIL